MVIAFWLKNEQQFSTAQTEFNFFFLPVPGG
jgi:hypothetical protein